MATPRLYSRSAVIQVMTEAALKASRSLLRDFGEVENLQVSQKGPYDFVSAADLRTEKILVEELKKARPSYGFLTEEKGEIPGLDPEYRWIIDPLDGTHNFIHSLPHFSLSIALEKKGVIVAGVTYDPIKDEMFWAEKGGGAFLNNRRLRVSSRRQLEKAMVAGSSHGTATDVASGHRQGGTLQWSEGVRKLTSLVTGVRKWGSTTLDLAYVAAGRFDGFWDWHSNPWDMAVGILLVQEAGGYVCDREGKATMMETESILASNDHLFNTFKSYLIS